MDDCGHDCGETLAEVERFIDGELDASVKVEIERHLADCHPCAERTEFQRHLKLMIATKCGRERVPVELQAKILQLIRQLDRSAPGP